MKLLSAILLFVLAVSLAIPLDSQELPVSDPAIEISEPILTNETGDSSEGSEATQSEATPSEAAQSKAEEVFDDTSLEFLDDQPDIRENVLNNEFSSYDERTISKRSTPAALSLWQSFKELLTWVWVMLLDIILKPTIAISTFIEDIFNKFNGQLNVGGNKPGEPMVRYNLNGDFNIPTLLNLEYWTTKFVKKLFEN